MKIVFSINCYYVKKENVNIRNIISILKSNVTTNNICMFSSSGTK